MRKKASVRSRPAVSSPSATESPLPSGGLLVVVELGAGWPHQACSQSAQTMRRVVAQVEGETPAVFAERVAGGLDSLFGRGIRLETVLMACNERVDEAADAARRKALSLALGKMARHKSGRAYLAAPQRSSGRLRHALSALAQGLADEWRTAALEVSVDFGEDARVAAPTDHFVFTARVA